MFKRIIRSLAVASLMATCLYFADCNVVEEPTEVVADATVSVETEPVERVAKEIKPDKVDIIKLDVPEVAEPVDAKPAEPGYYVDVVDHYITEDSLVSLCEYIGDIYDISPELLQAIAWVESRYKVDAVSSCNAKGLTQVMERWNRDRIKRLGVSDLYDPYSSILLCADIVDELKGLKYGNDISYVLMAYNMGATGAKKPYEAGRISTYAKNVLAKQKELEKEHRKL